ncbi:MAG: hypothetical protein HFJ50_01205 [Clostridia bacterium]|jgi:conjugal transfer ATP-binding protein TraC|nr:hypothetical protein [Clostridia bacterium]
MQKQKDLSLQEWLPFERILNDGIIKIKDNSYIKIMNVIPINYSLKSDLEKEGILNSYKTFLKTCNFDVQILIQSNKEDLSNHILKIKESVKKENNLNLYKISEKYIKFITKLNNEKKSSSKNFFIITKYEQNVNTREEIAIAELNERYFKIKECLSRCGNLINEVNEKEDVKRILFTFFNTRKNFLS